MRESDGLGWRDVLHQLNNIFASIHSSIDLAVAQTGATEVRPFLEQAQVSARRGAVLINNLRLQAKELPELAAKPEAHPARNAESCPSGAGRLEGSERILIAEDDESIRLLLRAVLSYRGYTVTEAADGEEAVRFYQKQGPFDLFICDLRMPKLDGPKALAQIRALNPKLRALALSGLGFDHEGVGPGTAPDGFDGCLSKPFDNTQLTKVVRDLLDR